MCGVLQGFPKNWPFQGSKTNAYRQVGNAFPPPVAEAVGRAVCRAILSAEDGTAPIAYLPTRSRPRRIRGQQELIEATH
jgi:DNA (cytosine-5)-methyltransferase 1